MVTVSDYDLGNTIIPNGSCECLPRLEARESVFSQLMTSDVK